MINSTERPDSPHTDHTTGDEHGTPADSAAEQDGVDPDVVASQDAARQQRRAERFPAGRVL